MDKNLKDMVMQHIADAKAGIAKTEKFLNHRDTDTRNAAIERLAWWKAELKRWEANL